MREDADIATGSVVGVTDSLVIVRIDGGAVRKNEEAAVRLGDLRLRAEVLQVQADSAMLQVFEDTAGVRVGSPVEFTGHLLSATLGPGLLGKIFDGLQNPLRDIAGVHGYALPRGMDLPPLDAQRRWIFAAEVAEGQRVCAGMRLGTVLEGHIPHAIVAPAEARDASIVRRIAPGPAALWDEVAVLETPGGDRISVPLGRRWPLRDPYGASFLESGGASRRLPHEPLDTGMRVIDTFFPIARGGTACIPGPFGAGKTVLQSLIARHSRVDVVLIVACGERAGEVVETLTTFESLVDPMTGGRLLDRTVIVCNTSSMPVAARETSVHLGLTIGEYYRQMGLHVLTLADSTSRWAQALREISGLMEEIPGEEAYPPYLDSHVRSLYDRAGVLRTAEGAEGSLTLIGTVSPAGGSFEEPVTQATLGTVRCFLGLSAERAYRRAYPALDPLLSWSRYFDLLQPWFEANAGRHWVPRVEALMQRLRRGHAAADLMRVAGEDGVTLEDFVAWLGANLIDRVMLQQDAFDPVDSAVPRRRQAQLLELVEDALADGPAFSGRESARSHFDRLESLLRNWNLSPDGSPEQAGWQQELDEMRRASRQQEPAGREPLENPGAGAQ